MSNISGSVPITGLIAPTDSTDTFAVIDPIWGIDGLRSVADHDTRDAIATLRRREGMIVYTQSDHAYWQLASDLVTWSSWGGGGGGGSPGGSDGQIQVNVSEAFAGLPGTVLFQTPGGDLWTSGQLISNGVPSLAIGQGSATFGVDCIALGANCVAIGQNGYAEGSGTVAGVMGVSASVSEDGGTLTASGDITSRFVQSDAIGIIDSTTGIGYIGVISTIGFDETNTVITLVEPILSSITSATIYDVTQNNGMYDHAEGQGTSAWGGMSHAEGQYTVASGEVSHAEGYSTNASGTYCHAEGIQTTASSNGDHAEGDQTTAKGGASHAEGGSTITAGAFSHTEGNYTYAVGTNCHAEGSYSASGNIGIPVTVSGTTLTAANVNLDQFFYNFSRRGGDNLLIVDTTTGIAYNGMVSTVEFTDPNSVITLNSVAGPDNPSVIYNLSQAGSCTHTEGTNTVAIGSNSHAMGWYSLTTLPNQLAQGGGQFSVPGDMQCTTVVASGTSNSATPAYIGLHPCPSWYTAKSEYFPIFLRDGITYGFRCMIVARQSDGSTFAMFRRVGLIDTDLGIIGEVQTEGTDINTPGWSVAITASDSPGPSLSIRGTGSSTATVNWVARIEFIEIGGVSSPSPPS